MQNKRNTGWTIYALVDPRTNEIRYVGRTINKPKIRFAGHISQLTESHKSRWIRQLIGKQLLPVLAVLETGDGHSGEAEKRWIRDLRAVGCNLTNSTDGGDGTPGCLLSETTRLKIGAAHKGLKFSPESKAKVAEALRWYWAANPQLSLARRVAREKFAKLNAGQALDDERRIAAARRSPEARKKLSEMARQNHLGRTLTEAHRAKISAANKGRVKSEAERQKISAALTGKKLSVEHRAALSAGQFRRAPASEQTRAKISGKLRGRPVSQETRQKIAASVAKAWKSRSETAQVVNTLSCCPA